MQSLHLCPGSRHLSHTRCLYRACHWSMALAFLIRLQSGVVWLWAMLFVVHQAHITSGVLGVVFLGDLAGRARGFSLGRGCCDCWLIVLMGDKFRDLLTAFLYSLLPFKLFLWLDLELF